MNVAIMHGRSEEYKKIKKMVYNLGFKPRVLVDEYQADTILENFRNLIWDEIHCVVILLTGDDFTIENKKRARQNVIFELGYCFAAFDSLKKNNYYSTKDAIIVIAENDVELFANIDGLKKIIFEKDNIESISDKIEIALTKTHIKARKYYDLI